MNGLMNVVIIFTQNFGIENNYFYWDKGDWTWQMEMADEVSEYGSMDLVRCWLRLLRNRGSIVILV